MEHLWVAEKIAGANRRRYGWDYDEVLASAYFGLCQAARRWDPLLSTARFSTFAVNRVQGEIKDRFRKDFGRAGQPKGDAKRAAQHTPFEYENFNEDHNEALADYSELPEDVVEQEDEEQRLKNVLQSAINTLAEREQRILHSYFFENTSLARIAASVNLSESRVSQIMHRALRRLKPVVAEGLA